MAKLAPEDIEFIKILATSDASLLSSGMSRPFRDRLEKTGAVLRQYYLENTADANTGWSAEFLQAGISRDDGRAAIACARRLGLEF